MSRYLLASFFGGLIGAGCVLIAMYVTNSKALVITTADINDAVSSLHSRINDFYLFAGIVITLLLAINVGVFIKADHETDKHIRENFDKREERIKHAYTKSQFYLDDLKTKRKYRKISKTKRHD
jgi:hypothetical protein